MNNVKIRKWLIAIMVCACSSVGMAQIDGGMGKPVVDSSRWIVNADAQSADVGISRYILRSDSGKNEMNILVMGNLDRMALVKMDETNGISSMCITMLSNGNQLDVFSSSNSIDVGWNSMTVFSVDDGGITGSIGGILGTAAFDVMNALTRDQNLRRFLVKKSSNPSVGVGCNEPCRSHWPQYDDCNGAWDEYNCCRREAQYDHCRRACECFLMHPLAGTFCTDWSNKLYLFELGACAADLVWVFS